MQYCNKLFVVTDKSCTVTCGTRGRGASGTAGNQSIRCKSNRWQSVDPEESVRSLRGLVMVIFMAAAFLRFSSCAYHVAAFSMADLVAQYFSSTKRMHPNGTNNNCCTLRVQRWLLVTFGGIRFAFLPRIVHRFEERTVSDSGGNP